jgi:hypothetical protein
MITARTCLLALVALLLAASNALATPSVTGLELVSEKRISRMVFEYTYRVKIQGDSSVWLNLQANLVTVGSGTTIVDPTVTLARLDPFEERVTADTITIRHDRLMFFDKSAWRWQFADMQVPPDPYNLDRSADLAGPDQDHDGVRDDIAAAITSFQLTDDKRRALMDVAKAVQLAVTRSQSKSEAYNNALEIQRAISCLASLDPDNFTRLVKTLEAITANTEARTYAYIQFHELLGPTIFPEITQPGCH